MQFPGAINSCNCYGISYLEHCRAICSWNNSYLSLHLSWLIKFSSVISFCVAHFYPLKILSFYQSIHQYGSHTLFLILLQLHLTHLLNSFLLSILNHSARPLCCSLSSLSASEPLTLAFQ